MLKFSYTKKLLPIANSLGNCFLKTFFPLYVSNTDYVFHSLYDGIFGYSHLNGEQYTGYSDSLSYEFWTSSKKIYPDPPEIPYFVFAGNDLLYMH